MNGLPLISGPEQPGLRATLFRIRKPLRYSLYRILSCIRALSSIGRLCGQIILGPLNIPSISKSQNLYRTQSYDKLDFSQISNSNIRLQTSRTMQIVPRLTIPLAIFLAARVAAEQCPICFDNTIRGCTEQTEGNKPFYYTCSQKPNGAHMIASFACDGGCHIVNGEPRCNNGKFKSEIIAMPLDLKCPWGLRHKGGKRSITFEA